MRYVLTQECFSHERPKCDCSFVVPLKLNETDKGWPPQARGQPTNET